MSGLNGVQGLEGWQWLFLLEGLPSVLIGVVAFFYLTDRPKDARWLSSEEREAIARSVEQEKRLTPHSHNGLLAAFKDFRVYLFAFAVSLSTALPTRSSIGVRRSLRKRV